MADAMMPAVPYLHTQALRCCVHREVRSQHRGPNYEFSTFHHAGSTSNEPLFTEEMQTARNLLGRISAFIFYEVVLKLLLTCNREHVFPRNHALADGNAVNFRSLAGKISGLHAFAQVFQVQQPERPAQRREDR